MLLSVFLSLSRDLILPGPNGAVGVQFSIGALKCLLPNEEQMPHKQALNKFVHLCVSVGGMFRISMLDCPTGVCLR